jgi:hypothetical protein
VLLQGKIPMFISNFYRYISKLGPKDPINYTRLCRILYQAAKEADTASEHESDACHSQSNSPTGQKIKADTCGEQPPPKQALKRSREEEEAVEVKVDKTGGSGAKRTRVQSPSKPADHDIAVESQPEE